MIKLNKIVLAAIVFVFVSQDISANSNYQLSYNEIKSIENSVNALSYKQLIDRRQTLLVEKDSLLKQASQENNQDSQTSTTDAPSTNDALRERIAKVTAELSAIQKALIAVAGVAAISAITDDGYNDNVPPVISINGSNPVTVELGTTYSDAGATAIDAFHGSTSVSVSSNVDTSTVGSYTVTYTATDLDNNTATATRTVNVVDTTAPVVVVTGDNPATVELGSTYTEAGATATDASGDVTVVITGSVDTDTLGTYTITYTSTDASGNSGTATRTVNVVDTTIPVFTSSATFIIDEGVTEVGTVTATDIQDITFSISDTTLLTITADGALSFIAPADYESQSDNPVNLPYDGSTYDVTATVTATDASSNAATQIITVSIRDVGGLDDNTETGTGTNTNTDTSTSTSTGTGTGTGTDTSTGTGTGTDTSTGTGTGTDTSTGTGTASGT